MKKRSLALFLAILMVFGSVLPVFATEPPVLDLGAGEETEETTLTYEDLYVDGAIFTWDATDKTAEDIIDFGEGSSIVLAENGDMQLILTKPTEGTAVYGDGYLEVTDAKSGAQLKLTNAYANVPEEVDAANAYTTQVSMAMLDFLGKTTPKEFGKDYVPFADKYGYSMLLTYGMKEVVTFIDADGIALFNAWSKAYTAAKNDEGLQASFRTPITKADYDLLAADDKYKDHVFTVEVGGEGVAEYSNTGYEADYTAFAYIISDDTRVRFYPMIGMDTDHTAKLFNNGIAKTIINTGAWVTDRDWKNTCGTIWAAKDAGVVATQTRINTATKTADGYKYDSAVYVDLTNVNTASKTSTNDPYTAGSKNMEFVAGLDARFYSVRIYDEALNDDQLLQNHFAELCEFNGVDLEKLGKVDAAGLVDLAIACKDMKLGDDNKAAIEAKIDEIIAADDVVIPEGDSIYDALYVDGALYRWDAFSGVAVKAGEAELPNKVGENALTISGATYDAQKKYVVTTKPFDFTALIEKNEDGTYVNPNFEFELVMTQTAFDGTHNTNNRPHLDFGEIDSLGSGTILVAEKFDIDSYGGYEAFYFGIRGSKTEAVTYYFDAEGNAVASPVAGGNEVTVTYHASAAASQVQICSQDWAGLKRYVGNPVGESYSIGGQLSFDAANYSASLKLIRDAKLCPSGTYSGISYVPGKSGSVYTAASRIVPATYEEALTMSARHYSLNHDFANAVGTFAVAGSRTTGITFGYSAFRLYDHHLTDAERQQNHFADLASYHQIDAASVEAFLALSDASKAAICVKFSSALIDDRMSVSNTSFEDVTKEELEAAIANQAVAEEELKKTALYDQMYVDGYTAFWNAYFKKDGAASSDTVLDIAGGSAVYTDGYLRALGSTLTVAGAYEIPANGSTVNYTTELIYASYNDGASLGGYTGEVKFETEYGVIFGKKVTKVFKTLAVTEDITYTDTVGRALQEAWASAYVAAENDDALKATFWTPISKTDYEGMIAAGQGANVRVNSEDVPAVGAYSTTGYEANWEGFQYVIKTLTRVKPGTTDTMVKSANFYHGYNFTTETRPGIGNSNIMKSDINFGGSWLANNDFESWEGNKANWGIHDFGVISNHTWVETVANNDGSYNIVGTAYNDTTELYSKTKSVANTVALSTGFSIKGFDADYYAIRVYPFTLTAEQTAQNHFADLASYVKIENIEAYHALSAEGKAALHAEFADMTFATVDKDAIEATIRATADKENAFAELGVSAENFFAFEGYQVNVWGKPAMRATFSVKNPSIEGVTIKEIGMGVSIGGGEPRPLLVYDGMKYLNTRTDGDNTYASYEISFAKSEEQKKASLTADFVFSGYVTISYQGIDFKMNCDMTSIFGEGVSMYELSCHEALKDIPNSVLVRSICEAE